MAWTQRKKRMARRAGALRYYEERWGRKAAMTFLFRSRLVRWTERA